MDKKSNYMSKLDLHEGRSDSLTLRQVHTFPPFSLLSICLSGFCHFVKGNIMCRTCVLWLGKGSSRWLSVHTGWRCSAGLSQPTGRRLCVFASSRKSWVSLTRRWTLKSSAPGGDTSCSAAVSVPSPPSAKNPGYKKKLFISLVWVCLVGFSLPSIRGRGGRRGGGGQFLSIFLLYVYGLFLSVFLLYVYGFCLCVLLWYYIDEGVTMIMMS